MLQGATNKTFAKTQNSSISNSGGQQMLMIANVLLYLVTCCISPEKKEHNFLGGDTDIILTAANW